MRFDGPLVQDSRRHLWGRATNHVMLLEWDGTVWATNQMAGRLRSNFHRNLMVDSVDRLWDTPNYDNSAVGLFNPLTGLWKIYPSYTQALQTQANACTNFNLGGPDERYSPVFAPGGRIAFRDHESKVNYFDGKSWRKWRDREMGSDHIEGPPFFNEQRVLCILASETLWTFTEAEGWRPKATAEAHPARRPDEARPLPPVPQGCPVEQPDAMACDYAGTFWLTRGSNVYVAVDGNCREIELGDQKLPQRIRAVLLDPCGNAFLQTSSHEYLFVPAERCPGTVHIAACNVTADGVAATFTNSARTQIWYRWRLDDAAWSVPRTNATLRLMWLTAGRHRLEVVALDDALRSLGPAATARIEIRVDEQQQLDDIIAVLGHKDLAWREAAVAELAKRGPAALPRLKAARNKMPAEQRLWHDTAIEQINSAPSK